VNAANRVAKLNVGSEACTEYPINQSSLPAALSFECVQGNSFVVAQPLEWAVKGPFAVRQATTMGEAIAILATSDDVKRYDWLVHAMKEEPTNTTMSAIRTSRAHGDEDGLSGFSGSLHLCLPGSDKYGRRATRELCSLDLLSAVVNLSCRNNL
jgi:hypothetical protein